MEDLDQRKRKRPGVAFAGFLVPFALLMAVMAAHRAQSFDALGWHGGEYAYAFIGVALGAVVVGALLKAARPPWPSVGTGMILAGTVGVLIAIAIVALFVIAFSGMVS
ncbi:polyferredoxin [Saccharothrix ecbatanensis]|uniref:Polyferredoxin n=1 Tax=Saccharothrix ecbatanensis TaxID=1105145 RepID=A0A7W9HHV8_9PSEU|nr:hypothetical protein [Saccharothrix ecbatanensis]MBB5802593.1 polyferredoxin [Saccharothrix ecbatanensis]